MSQALPVMKTRTQNGMVGSRRDGRELDTSRVGYDKTDTPAVITRVAQAMLAKLGSLLKAMSGAVNLIRV